MSKRREFRPAGIDKLEDRLVLSQAATISHTVTAFAITATTAQTQNTAYVQSLYNFVGRTPNTAGIAYHANQLSYNTATRYQIASQFLATPEFRSSIVSYAFTQLLGRTPSAAESATYVSYLGGKNNTFLSGAALLLSSAEFYTLSGGTNQGFITNVYRDVLRRAPDASAQGWVTALNSGVSRNVIAHAILRSPESAANFVTFAYDRVLQRAPDAVGARPYVNYIQHGGSIENVFASLLASQEYYNGVQTGKLGTRPFAFDLGI